MDFSSFSPRRKMTLIALFVGIVFVVGMLLLVFFGKTQQQNELPIAPPLPAVPANPPSEYPMENDKNLPPPPALPVE